MIFQDTTLCDARLIAFERRTDSRGWFARAFCEAEFAAAGAPMRPVQQNASVSIEAGTLRGMHFQRPPHAEAKLVRCLSGAIYDVIIDLRPTSPTFGRWEGFTLAGGDGRQLYVPEGFAHGFLTLSPATEVSYLVSAAYTPEAEGGLRWNDPAFAIDWPGEIKVISEKDSLWPDWRA